MTGKFKISLTILALTFSLLIHAQEKIGNDSLNAHPKLEKLVSKLRINGDRSVFYIAPSLGYDSNSGWEFGLVPILSVSPVSDSSMYYRSSKYTGFFSYSTMGWLNLKNELEIFGRSGRIFGTKVQYVESPKSIYSFSNEEYTKTGSYNLSALTGEIILQKYIRESLISGLKFDAGYVSVSDKEGQISKSLIPVDYDYFVSLGGMIKIDTRDYNNYPSKGWYVIANIGLVNDNVVSDFYSAISVDLRKYLIFRNKNILAFQIYSDYNTSNKLPHYMLSRIAGKDRLRGISSSEIYKSSNCAYAQIEYRRMLWWRFGCAAFGGFGETGAFSSNLHYDLVYGLGLRFLAAEKDKLNLRFDYGRDIRGGSSVFFTIGEAF